MATISYSVDNLVFHTSATIYITGTMYVERPSELSSGVHVWGDVTFRTGPNSFYLTPPYTGYTRGLSLYVSSPNNGNAGETKGVYGMNKGQSKSTSLDTWIDWTEGNLYVHVTCNWTGYHECDKGYNDQTIFSFNIGNLPYNPYSPPSININSYTQIGRVDSTNYNVNYNVNRGTDNLHWTRIQRFNYDTKAFINFNQYNRTNTGNYNDTYQLNSPTYTNASRYRMAMSTYDGRSEPWSPNNPGAGGDGYTIYTYQEPTIGTQLNVANNTQNANTSNTFSVTNVTNRAWPSFENDFQTQYRIKRGTDNFLDWVNLGNITSWSRTAAEIRALVPKAYDTQTITMQMRRYNSSANWYSANTANGNFIVYYRPRKGVTTANTSYFKNASGGTGISKGQVIINDSSLTGIYVSWSYDTTTPDAGYTQGYRIRLYDSSGTTVVKTYYTANKNFTIPKADIPRIQNTYIDITPYFANDTSTPASYWYYSGAIEKSSFIILSSNLAKPVITYPIQNSNWLNREFRVCFTLPQDPDKGSEPESYRYDGIEVQINGNFTIKTMSSLPGADGGPSIIYPTAFSAWSNNLTYQRKIIVNPSLATGFPISSSYTIRIRVKKRYGTSGAQTLWSEWSDNVNITVTPASFNPNKDEFILASHYNNAKALLNRVRSTYGVLWNIPPADVISKQTNILTTQYPYTNFFKLIVDTKYAVNNFGTFDTGREHIKFNNINQTLYSEKIDGNSTQVQVQGSPNTLNIVDSTYRELSKVAVDNISPNQVTIHNTVNEDNAAYYIRFRTRLQKGTWYFKRKFEVLEGAESGYMGTTHIAKSDWSTVYITFRRTPDGSGSFTLTEDTDVFLTFGLQEGTGTMQETKKCRHYDIILSRQDVPFEPFTVPTPSPEKPSPIISLGSEEALNIPVRSANMMLKQSLSTPAGDNSYWNSLSNVPNYQCIPLDDGWLKINVNKIQTADFYPNFFTQAAAGIKPKPNSKYTIFYQVRNKVNVPVGKTIQLNSLPSGITSMFATQLSTIAVDTAVDNRIYSKLVTSSASSVIDTTSLYLRSFTIVKPTDKPFSLEYRMWVVEGDRTAESIPFRYYLEDEAQLPVLGNRSFKSLPNGVKDTFSVTGTSVNATRNIGITDLSSVIWTTAGQSTANTDYYYAHSKTLDTTAKLITTPNNLYSNRFIATSNLTTGKVVYTDTICIQTNYNIDRLRLMIKKNLVDTHSGNTVVEKLTNFFKFNSTVIQYELATPTSDSIAISYTIPENFTPTQELITAASNEGNEPNGRDYMKIVYDRCNKLV